MKIKYFCIKKLMMNKNMYEVNNPINLFNSRLFTKKFIIFTEIAKFKPTRMTYWNAWKGNFPFE